jgi:putative endopeptidase
MTHRNFSLGVVALSLTLGVSSLRAQDSNLPPSLAAPVDTPAASIKPMEPKKTVSFDLTSIDKTADPCTDFYQYSCGNWVKTNPIPSDQPRWGAFNQISERNRYLLYTELDRASKPSPKRTALQQKYGDFFAACMDEDLANREGIKPIEPALAAIAALQDKKQIAELVGTLESKYADPALFNFGVGQDEKDSTKQIAEAFQGGTSLPDRDYYLGTGERYEKIRGAYLAHVTKIFELAGDPAEKAEAEAKSVLTIETALAKGQTPRVELRNPEARYHIQTLTAFEQTTPNFDWSTYLQLIGIGKFDSLNVATPKFFADMNTIIDREPMDAFKSYFRWRTIHNAAPALSDAFVNENFDFYGKTLQGQPEIQARWKRCTAQTDKILGEAVGQDWVKENFPPQSKTSMLKLVNNLETALAEDIKQLDWMSDATKAEAEKKLSLIRNKIGYPDQWRDYSSLVIKRDDPIGNLARGQVFENKRELAKLGKPVDEKEWGMTPPTVNAYYASSFNDINFPAGILQPPFFDPNIDPAVNYGGIGVVIGHEMTHGFDDQGSKFDGLGNLREWQTEADRKAFTERTDCEVKEYGNFESVPGTKLNGKLTLGENTADNGGIRIAYIALMKALADQHTPVTKQIDGYTEAQRFFIGFGQVWCENRSEAYSRNAVLTDPHSPGRFRVNGTVQNFDEFGKAFHCKKGQPMYPENSCRVW